MSEETSTGQQQLVLSSYRSTTSSPVLNEKKNTLKSKPTLEPLLLSVSDVATILGVSRQTVYTYIYSEGLPSISVGRIRRIDPASLRKWISQREVCYGQTTRTSRG